MRAPPRSSDRRRPADGATNPMDTHKPADPQPKRVAPVDRVEDLRRGRAVLVDIREPKEWEGGVARSAVLLPMSDLNGPRILWADFLRKESGREILLYCAAGGRAGRVAKILADEGYRAANTGGFGDWTGSGWPVDRAPAEKP